MGPRDPAKEATGPAARTGSSLTENGGARTVRVRLWDLHRLVDEDRIDAASNCERANMSWLKHLVTVAPFA